MRPRKTKATSVDIAHRAGVSQATVSRVLRGGPLVNADTRKRVLDAVQELNYKVDRRASSLRTQRAGTLALLLFEDPTEDGSQINPFFLSMLGSITRACARHNHDLLVSFQQLSDNWHADYENSMKARRPDPAGLRRLRRLPPETRTPGRTGHAFRALGRGAAGPAGRVDRRQFSLADGWSANIFSASAASASPSSATPPVITRNSTRATAAARSCNARSGIGRIGAAGRCAEFGGRRLRSGEGAARPRHPVRRGVRGQRPDRHRRDPRTAREHGLRVPEDIAVVGFDDIAMSRFCNPPLTTVYQDTASAGELLVETLLKRVHEQPAESRMLPATLVVRRSSGAAG